MKDESEKELRSIVRQTAVFFREKFFRVTDAQIRTRILGVQEEYFDGESYTVLEINNLSELSGIKEEKLLPILKKIVAAGEFIEGRR